MAAMLLCLLVATTSVGVLGFVPPSVTPTRAKQGMWPLSVPRASRQPATSASPSSVVEDALGVVNGESNIRYTDYVETASFPPESSVLSTAEVSEESAAPAAPKRRRPLSKDPQLIVEGDSTQVTPYQQLVTYGTLALALAAIAQALVSDASNPALMSLMVPFALLFGDLFSGVFHWAVDNYGNKNTPVFGSVIEGFQGHHKYPWTITYRPFANNVYKICYGVLLIMATTFILQAPPAVRVFMTVFGLSQVMAQEFHKYSHMTKPPIIVQRLQGMGLMLPRKEHGLHHSEPFEGHYSILFGWFNPLLDHSQVFRLMERAIYKWNGHMPNSWKLDERLRQEQVDMIEGSQRT
ncbi:unnamed protein product [Vitrella brassicaformis CCMP3155]|uniref:Lipid desaturase domain-containing protein n=2 Tax=Vitrella brassicaformis TaxID=1169539 RepID=A0A0G4F217_VITBC|nr:unnamed protein product [Vitrella brassicaformis CCMP3155]|eukprot:CEM05794.1 unnamed protein product [Vitrella brassicaformis CCMP3155]